ncbi:hypothetical protein HU200_049882 [Digitaria exilis]|uniref:Uncharacterized protein n=1 Tax=Digitaria exilis TaxID=1010633 RepID=A0A835B3N6_9POAL|nr:hypothetical protein HU200_049882 [Digitaria exilis]
MTEEERAKEQSEILRIKREGGALRKRTLAEEAEIWRLKRDTKLFAAEEEELQPAAGNKRRKKVIKKTLVTRAAIEHIISNPFNPLHGFREEKLATYSQELRQAYFKQKAITDNVLEYQRALIKQFHKKDYAENYKEIEVTDDEQDN